jgi:hypothetical protein
LSSAGILHSVQDDNLRARGKNNGKSKSKGKNNGKGNHPTLKLAKIASFRMGHPRTAFLSMLFASLS